MRKLALRFRHRGDKVQCPLCSSSFRSFVPFGVYDFRRDNAWCPRCGSLERHRLQYLFLQERTTVFEDKLKVLHVAPEPCFEKNFSKLPNLEYVSGDIDPGIGQIELDVTDIQFQEGHFDVILCSHVLEHVPDDGKAASELFRILKKDGWAIIPSFQDTALETTDEAGKEMTEDERLRKLGHVGHLRVYGNDYQAFLEAAGFKVEQIPFGGEIDPALVEKHGLDRDEIIWLCTKP